MVYNIHYDVCAMMIAAFAISFVLIKKGLQRRQNRFLLCLLVLAFITAFFDILTAFGNTPSFGWSLGAKDFCNYAYLGLHSVMPYFVCRYVISLTGFDYEENRRGFFMVSLVPLVSIMVILFFNIWTRWVFYYDDAGFYRHGIGFYYLHSCVYLYFVICILLLLRFGKTISAGSRVTGYTLMIASLGALIFQTIYQDLLIQLCVESLCLLGAVVTQDDLEEILDPESGCYNRRAFIQDFQLQLRGRSVFKVVFVRPGGVNRYVTELGVQHMATFRRMLGSYLMALESKSECYYVENDQYIILCDDTCNTEEMLQKIRQRFEDGWRIEDYRLDLYVQLSDAVVPEEIASLEEMLLILTAGKEEETLLGSEQSVEKTVEKFRSEIELEEAVRRGLRYEDMEVYYQPVWNVGTNRIAFGEALIRLNDKKLGPVSSRTIISIARKKGFGREIEKYVLDKACAFVAEHPLDELGVSHISTNLSRELLLGEDTGNMIENVVDHHKIRHSKIGFEFSGDSLIRNNPTVHDTLVKMQESGYRLTLERFGAGHTDISDLADYPADSLKIDSTLLKKAVCSDKAYVVLATAIRMGKRLGLQTIAVGVESEDEKEILRNLGCDLMQGSYFSEAMPAEEFYHYCAGFNRE